MKLNEGRVSDHVEDRRDEEAGSGSGGWRFGGGASAVSQ